MRKDVETDLLFTKFKSSTPKLQAKLFHFLTGDRGSFDNYVDLLNNIKLKNEELNITEGEMITVDLHKLNSYPRIYVEYYQANDLIINERYVKLAVEYINPVTNYIGVRYVTKVDGSEEVVDVYPNYLPDQRSFDIII